MTSTEHGELRRGLAAYALGALEPAERAAVEEHLQDCSACRDELASLAVLPGLLSRLSSEEAADDLLLLPEGHADHVVAAVGDERRRDRRRLVLWRTVAGLAAAAVVALATVLVWSPSPTGTVFAATTSASDATATVIERAWGMEVRFEATGLPDRQGFVLWAVDDDGHRAQVASWADTGRPTVRVVGSCYMPAGEVQRLEVTDPDEAVVVTLAG